MGAYGKSYWPGNIRALRVGSMPQDSLRGLASRSPLQRATPQSWLEANQIVAEVLASAARSGDVTEYGWEAQGEPDCDASTAEAELSRARAIIDVTLPVDAPPATNAATQVAEAAVRLRRARRGAADGAAWGALVGRLRAFAAANADARAALRQVFG